MKEIVDRSNCALQIAASQGIGFDKALKQAEKLIAASNEYIEAHTPREGKRVRCINNTVIDPSYAACEKLSVGKEYTVTGERDSMIFVEDIATGEKITEPLHMVRFEAIV